MASGCFHFVPFFPPFPFAFFSPSFLAMFIECLLYCSTGQQRRIFSHEGSSYPLYRRTWRGEGHMGINLICPMSYTGIPFNPHNSLARYRLPHLSKIKLKLGYVKYYILCVGHSWSKPVLCIVRCQVVQRPSDMIKVLAVPVNRHQ